MILFVVVIAIMFVQVWGSENPLHKDRWFTQWLEFLNDKAALDNSLRVLASLILPVILFVVFSWVVYKTSYWLLLPLNVAVLLYSFGRGEFSATIESYSEACSSDDWESAAEHAEQLGLATNDTATNDWSSLHLQFLEQAAYRGFERMFAVLFWFFVFGAAGALAYRLTQLMVAEEQDNKFAKKILWIIEWPAARVLGLSFAFTGNFVACIQRWRESLFCTQRPTEMTIGRSVLGALSVGDELIQTCDVTKKELELLDKLYKRTLWFWIASVAVFVLLS